MLGLLLGFAVAHSGLASLRMRGEAIIGARLYRVLFALVSIPLAVILVVYFFNHRYDGLLLWQVQGVTGVKTLVWILSAISFFFLYPATFNLLEIAAIQKPQVHLYETGILRVTRHPQMVGQVIWCIGHTLWLGTSFTLLTSKWQEFLRPAYLGVTGFILLLWWAHPWLMQATSKIYW